MKPTALIWLLLILSTTALADHHKKPIGPMNGAGKALHFATTPQHAAALAKQRQPGKVLSVKRNNGFYKVKMLHEGKVRYVTVKAK